MDLKKKNLLLEKPQDINTKTVYQKRKCEEKSTENIDREKSNVYIEKMRWNKRKMIIEHPAFRHTEV